MNHWFDKIAAYHEGSLEPEEKLAYEHECLDNPALKQAHQSWQLAEAVLQEVQNNQPTFISQPSSTARFWVTSLLFALFIAASAFYYSFLKSYPTPQLELYDYEGIEVIDLQNIPQAMIVDDSDELILGKVTHRAPDQPQPAKESSTDKVSIEKEVILVDEKVALKGEVKQGERLIVMATKSIFFKPGFSAGPGTELHASIQADHLN